MKRNSNSPASPEPSTAYRPLTGGKLVIATIVGALATFMCASGVSIANVAIPTISGNLGVSVDEGAWVITMFSTVNAVSMPLTGWFAQRSGQVRLLVGSILMCALVSWLCGIAPNLPFRLAAGVLQGVVAGPMIPLSLSVLLSAYPTAKAGLALTLWAMTATAGPITGPILGGWITDNYSWS